MKTVVAVEKAVTGALQSAGPTRWIACSIEETTTVRHRQETRGRPGANIRYRPIETTGRRISFRVRDNIVAADAYADDCWPLITCDHYFSAVEILTINKHQPHLERRHHMLKVPQAVAPMFLHDAARIEGLLTYHFIATLVPALVEREIRPAMATCGLKEFPLYPEGRGYPAPSTPRLSSIFSGSAHQHLVTSDSAVVQIFEPELTKLQRLVLELLDIPVSVYR